MAEPRVLITGAGGQVGSLLVATAPGGVTLLALDRTGLDIGDAAAVHACVRAEQPSVIINAAAYTAVDKAETEPALAQRINGDGAAHLAAAAQAVGARLVHVSTDFVFDGEQGRPYRTDAPLAPLGVYGATKADGERRVRETLAAQAVIVRTAWVYAARGRNFLHTMLRLMRERESVRVVADQVGSPTAARGLAQALWACALDPAVHGVLHWTDAGVASWYDFAVAIEEEARAAGLLTRPCAVQPIATADYPTPARRPAYSVLDKTATLPTLGLQPRHWRENLRETLREMRDDA